MPKNKVSDPITDQEMAFARLVLSGKMTDRQAAETAGLNPDSAAYIKSKPQVRAYMLEHRAAVEQQLVLQEAEGIRRRSLDREQVLDRLWEIAKMSPEMTRGSVTGQVKALSMIVAMESFIPGRHPVSSEKNSPTVLANPLQGYTAVGLVRQPATMEPQPSPVTGRGVSEATPARPASPGEPRSVPWDPPVSQSPSANRIGPSKAPLPYVPLFNSVPDLGFPLSMVKNPFVNAR
jgi:hypothetical protein